MKNRTTQRNKIKEAINVSQGTSYLRIASKLELARNLGVSRQLVAKYIKGELQNAND
jgi:transcriptional regulator with XRE-family HTH domain